MASNPRSSAYDSNLATAFLWPFKSLFWLAFIYFLLGSFCIVLGLLFTYHFWVNPVEASDMLLKSEVAGVNNIATHGMRQLTALTEFTSRWSYWIFFQATTLHDAVYAYLNNLSTNQVDRIFLKEFVGRNAREIYISMNLIQVFGIRLGFLVAGLPLYWLIYWIALCDGMTERYIRRACAGRESSDMYKLGKLSRLMILVSGMTFYLCVPIAMNPYWVVCVFVMAIAIGTRVEWKYYKKYL